MPKAAANSESTGASEAANLKRYEELNAIQKAKDDSDWKYGHALFWTIMTLVGFCVYAQTGEGRKLWGFDNPYGYPLAWVLIAADLVLVTLFSTQMSNYAPELHSSFAHHLFNLRTYSAEKAEKMDKDKLK